MEGPQSAAYLPFRSNRRLVRPRRLELPRLAALAPQASASTNSAMAAPDRWRGGYQIGSRSGKARAVHAHCAGRDKYRFCHNDPARMAHFRRPGALRRGVGGHGGARRRHPGRPRPRARLAAGASAALHRRHQRQGRTTCCSPMRFPVHVAGRGGQYTYHGPGQRVVYAMLDLRPSPPGRAALRRPTSRNGRSAPSPASTCAPSAAPAGSASGWRARQAALPDGSPREDKIAAIGVRIRHWVSFHGLSINVEPDLSHYAGIVPCGIAEHGVTSLVDLGLPVTLTDLDAGAGRDLRRGVRQNWRGCCRESSWSDRARPRAHERADARPEDYGQPSEAA